MEPLKRTNLIDLTWKIVGIVLLVVISVFVLRAAFNVLLMILAGSLISIYFHGIADFLCKYSKLKYKLCLIIAVILSFIAGGLILWFLGARISEQVSELSRELPVVIKGVEEKLSASSLGRKMLSYITGNNSQKLMNSFQSIFRTSFGVIGDIYIILFIGIFFTIDPKVYQKGFLQLIPTTSRPKTIRIMKRISFTLKNWLAGMLIAMLFIAILTVTGLTIIGVPMALALAVIAGFLNFIPNFGPLLAMIPAVLISLTIDLNTAMIVFGLYLFVQIIESNIVTPMVQKAMIEIPPGLIIIGQVLFGTLIGGLGVIFATPLLAIIMVVVDELYVKRMHKLEEEHLLTAAHPHDEE